MSESKLKVNTKVKIVLHIKGRIWETQLFASAERNHMQHAPHTILYTVLGIM